MFNYLNVLLYNHSQDETIILLCIIKTSPVNNNQQINQYHDDYIFNQLHETSTYIRLPWFEYGA